MLCVGLLTQQCPSDCLENLLLLLLLVVAMAYTRGLWEPDRLVSHVRGSTMD